MSVAVQVPKLLEEILSQPSAPFREAHVIALVERVLAEGGVPHFRDPTGNIVIGAASAKDYAALLREKTHEPLRLFVAHMDHPGFHGVSARGDSELEIRWHGGSPLEHLEGARMWLASAGGWLGHGTLTAPKMLASGRALESATVKLERPLSLPATEVYGGFAFRAPQWREGDRIYTKAADDLVGAYAIVSLALELFGAKNGSKRKSKKNSKTRPPLLGLLTRAEEVGFIGAIGHFELGWHLRARRPLLCVSLETSRALPGAEIGKGPVVRLGDRYTVFDAWSLRVFTELAAAALPGAHQRRVMDGGTCEATAATAYGLPCVGISVPLGNYHNQSFEGGPDSAGPNGPAPEFVDLRDVDGLLALCRGLLRPKLPWHQPWERRRREFKKELKRYQPLLKSGP
jgi:endoglucanase